MTASDLDMTCSARILISVVGYCKCTDKIIKLSSLDKQKNMLCKRCSYISEVWVKAGVSYTNFESANLPKTVVMCENSLNGLDDGFVASVTK